MKERRERMLRPNLEPLEAKVLLSGGRIAARARDAAEVAVVVANTTPRYTLERITNPTPFNTRLVPPLKQVMVQARPPISGQTYNILSITMRNSTQRTFVADDNLRVSVTGQTRSFPILQNDDSWKPREVRIFYILSKEYYPLRPTTSAGFQFEIAGSKGIAIPGPSGIFLRIKYRPATISRILNHIVVNGPGAKGRELGLPDTSLWEFLPSRLNAVPL